MMYDIIGKQTFNVMELNTYVGQNNRNIEQNCQMLKYFNSYPYYCLLCVPIISVSLQSPSGDGN